MIHFQNREFPLVIGIPKETSQGETRVALTPALIPPLIKARHSVLVETGAGKGCGITDEDYKKAGAHIAKSASAVYSSADVVFKIEPPQLGKGKKHEVLSMKKGAVYFGFLSPFTNLPLIEALAKKGITAISFELVPRITRAQNMDALSSMATLAGYRAVIAGATKLPKMFPLLMTAAGTVPPAHVLVLGAGVAGLQAIATAKRLGAKVSAYDPRPEVKEQVASVGGTFIEIPAEENVTTTGGYAKEQSAAFIQRQRAVLKELLPKVDLVVTTAQVFGKRAPVLMTKDMVEAMKTGSVIVDLAAPQGGNCELTVAGKEVVHKGVAIIGAMNLPATLPVDASMLLGKNFINLFQNTFKDGSTDPDMEDDITKGACVTAGGKVVHPLVQQASSNASGERKKK